MTTLEKHWLLFQLSSEFASLKPNTKDAAKLGEAMGARLKEKKITQ